MKLPAELAKAVHWLTKPEVMLSLAGLALTVYALSRKPPPPGSPDNPIQLPPITLTG